ncbi:O-succinylbenzoic acid--CoA ligase [Euzebyella marina]|uniref:O-succinylbenzoic acid--CoA ligase n=1 Tax=Euzebyella marina TaxID=1761453 RepID=A0A3G2L7U1_9FLAO|nr:AMP-binding protein [Euzebyella marina]AYN68296.1 O-succinylbenzoic acid--CoA ligase [Euzebyella marina]
MGNKRKVHKNFKLQGVSCNDIDLHEIAYSLVKEGDKSEKAIGDFILDWLDDKPFIKVSTSGSTGAPKQISILKKFMANSAKATGNFFGLKENTTALLCLPCNYIAGKMMLVRAMVLGWHLDYIEPSASLHIPTDRVYDFSAMVPLQVQNSLNELSSINTLIVGGAPFSSSLKKKLVSNDVSTKVYETYGMTETVTHVALKKVHPIDQVEYFLTLPDVDIRIDERGCLVINAPKISVNEVVTNDIVSLISNNEFEWLGRFDNVVNSGGVKLFPEQIEAKLAKVIEPRFFVTGLPDENLGQKLVLLIEGDPELERIRLKIESLKVLDRFERPKEIYFLKKFTETSSGKVQRQQTLDQLAI